MQNTKRQHYIPRFYIENFVNKTSNVVYIFNKVTKKIYSSNSKDVCVEANFFTFDNEFDMLDTFRKELKINPDLNYKNIPYFDLEKKLPFILEDLLSKVESNVAPILQNIINNKNLKNIDGSQSD